MASPYLSWFVTLFDHVISWLTLDLQAGMDGCLKCQCITGAFANIESTSSRGYVNIYVSRPPHPAYLLTILTAWETDTKREGWQYTI